MWCFPDRATPESDDRLRRLESHIDEAIVPWLWRIEVANALGKAVARGKVPLAQVLAILDELLRLPIRQVAIGNISHLVQLAVKYNLSVYDACYLETARASSVPLATHDRKLAEAALADGVVVISSLQ